MTSFGGKGECWLSTKLNTEGQPCVEQCESFAKNTKGEDAFAVKWQYDDQSKFDNMPYKKHGANIVKLDALNARTSERAYKTARAEGLAQKLKDQQKQTREARSKSNERHVKAQALLKKMGDLVGYMDD